MNKNINVQVLIIAIALVISVNSYSNQQNCLTKRMTSSSSGLGFNNRTGSCINSTQVNMMIQLLNDASEYYTDVKNNMIYIQTQIDQYYGSGFHSTVYIMTQDFKNWYSIYTYKGCTFLELERGVNQKNSNWSYLIVINSGIPTISNYVYSFGFDTGRRITPDTVDVIRSIIVEEEKSLPNCDCTAVTGNIQAKIASFNPQNLWTVVCSETVIYFYAYFATVNDQWLVTYGTFNGCTYSIHATFY